MRKIFTVVAAVLAGVIALAGCGATADVKPDEVALRYSGTGFSYEAETFRECYLTPFAGRTGGNGDKVYTYPAGQRTFKFSNDPGSDAPPMQVTVQGGLVMTVAGTVTFTPQFTDCDRLRDFHERIGRKFQAFTRGADDTTTIEVEGQEGWREMLGTYVKDPVDRAVDDASLGYTWQQLSSDPSAKAAWEATALENIPNVMRQQSGGDFFRIDSVILQKPDLPQAVADGLQAQERARLDGEAAAAAAEAARACDRACQEYQESQARINLMNRSSGIPVLPVPYGSPVQVNVPQATP
jgi:hypothetical protein